MKKSLFFCVLFAVVISVALWGCSSDGGGGVSDDGGDDGGGAGAEFDETLYYTKTEVDAAITAAIPDTSGGEPQNIPGGGTGFDYRTDGWSVPDGASYAIFVVQPAGNVLDETGNIAVTIGTGATTSDTISFLDGTHYQTGIVSVVGMDTIYAWADTDAGVGNEIKVYPVIWFK